MPSPQVPMLERMQSQLKSAVPLKRGGGGGGDIKPIMCAPLGTQLFPISYRYHFFSITTTSCTGTLLHFGLLGLHLHQHGFKMVVMYCAGSLNTHTSIFWVV